MSLSQQVAEYIRACFTGIWIETQEPEDALAELARLCRAENWTLATWDLEHGFALGTGGQQAAAGGADPLTAVRALGDLARPEGAAVLVLRNFHRLLTSAEIVQGLASQLVAGKQQRTFVVILSPVVQIPIELEKLFVVLWHALPDRDQLHDIARGIATEPGELPAGNALETVLDAAAGLTRHEAEAAYSLALVRAGHITAETVWELKCQTLKKSGLLTLHRGGEDFGTLGGLVALKAFTRRALLQPQRQSSRPRPRGVLLLSPPGCGKSQFCKALGREVGRPVLILDVGSLFGSLVGQSEERTRQALKIVDAMAPCVLMIDEVEKAFAGVQGQGDSGVCARMFGTFLSWLNDHESDVFVVCTANDVTRLPPEFSRAERFDAVFFLDLPVAAERAVIWQIYQARYALDAQQARPEDRDWTGAEIRACCRLAALLDVPLVQAAEQVVPIAVTAAEAVTRLRTWAGGRCLSADRPGLYQYRPDTSTDPTPRRRVRRDPSAN